MKAGSVDEPVLRVHEELVQDQHHIALRLWREQAPLWIREADALGVKLD